MKDSGSGRKTQILKASNETTASLPPDGTFLHTSASAKVLSPSDDRFLTVRNVTVPSLEVIRPDNEGKLVTWMDITVKVPLAKKSLFQHLKISRDVRKMKTVLSKVSGYANPGTILAIMGCSGTGKTVLLNALTRNVSNDIEVLGKVFVNGEELSAIDMHRASCYVHQDDMFIGTLTVKEQLVFSAELRMDSKLTKAEKLSRVEDVLKELGLKRCETTLIGVPNRIKGISCGESKRLAFACEILNDPPILFCDEPTSGLDSFMAVQVVNCLKNMAKKGKTVITTIHQPSSQVFNMFDNVCFMSMGKVAYFGPVNKVCDFFRKIGYACPETYNPADYVIKILSTVQDEQKCQERIHRIRTKFEESELGMALYRKSHGQGSQQGIIGNIDLKHKRSYAASFVKQFWILMQRSFLTTMRDPLLLKVKLIQVITTAIIIGIVNFRTEVTGPTVMNLEGILYNTVRDMNFMFLFPSIRVITAELPIFLREHQSSRIYSTPAYYLAKSVAEFPEYTVLPLLYAFIVYFMSGLYLSVKAFLTYCVLTVILAYLAVSIAYAGASIFGEDSLAVTYMPCFTLPSLVFGGFYIGLHTIPFYYRYVAYISWFRYGFEAFQINQWTNYATIPGCENSRSEVVKSIQNYCPADSGRGLLVRRGLGTSESVIVINTVILVAMFIGFRVIGLLALLLRVRFTK